jgi:hypothetical protein
LLTIQNLYNTIKILQPKNDGDAFLVVGGGLYQGEDEDGGHSGDDGQGDPEGAVLVRLQAPPPLVGPANYRVFNIFQT